MTCRGSCLCRDATFEIEAPYREMGTCYCSRCRKASGSACSTYIVLDAKQLTWLTGEAGLKTYEADGVEWTFCSNCGSWLTWRGQDGTFCVEAGVLDDDPGCRPTERIYVDSRAPWDV